MLLKYDLGFGNAVAVRQAFLKTYHGEMVVFTSWRLSQLDYPDKEGDLELVEITKKVIKRQTGQDYKHVLLTNGATGGVVIALRAFKMFEGYMFCGVRKAPWYLRYPCMVQSAGMMMSTEWHPNSIMVYLMDFPSNPLGLVNDFRQGVFGRNPTIIDGVYHGQVYSKLAIPLPEHDVFVGSYSKLLGLNGIRVGWIATNSDKLYNYMKILTTAEYCGISMPSTEILKSALRSFNWDSFESLSRAYLDSNREEFSKLEKYFGTTVPPIGMFYYGNTDSKCKKIIEKASIGYTSGLLLGTNDNYGRLNMGQDRDVVRNAVEDFLKADQLKR